ncbi:MAG: hypothetical protein ACI4AM_05905 [Muribaculaceae bacterium]
MKRLYGKTILVGRSQQGNMLNVNVVGTNKVGVINRPVPGSVSRLQPAEQKAHLCLTIDPSGNIKAKNLKEANCTYVNRLEISTKTVKTNDILELGKDHFQIAVQDILNAAKQLVPNPVPVPPVPNPVPGPVPKPDKPKPTYNVHHLRRIWDDYKEKCKDIQVRRTKAMRNQRLPMLFSMGGGTLGFILACIDERLRNVGGITSIIGFCLMFFFWFRDPTLRLTEEKEQLDKDLEHMYLCPNPECNKMLPMKDIDFILRQYDHKCPYCKCNYVDKH